MKVNGKTEHISLRQFQKIANLDTNIIRFLVEYHTNEVMQYVKEGIITFDKTIELMTKSLNSFRLLCHYKSNVDKLISHNISFIKLHNLGVIDYDKAATILCSDEAINSIITQIKLGSKIIILDLFYIQQKLYSNDLTVN